MLCCGFQQHYIQRDNVRGIYILSGSYSSGSSNNNQLPTNAYTVSTLASPIRYPPLPANQEGVLSEGRPKKYRNEYKEFSLEGEY